MHNVSNLSSPFGARSVQVELMGLANQVLKVAEIIDSNEPACRALVRAARTVLAATPAPPPRGTLAPWRLRRALDYIDRNLERRIQVQELARIAKLSAGHFARAFKETTGETVTGFITGVRIERAKIMLASGTQAAQVAAACGFSDQPHLTRTFAQWTGVTPGRWRREVGRAHAYAA